MCGIAAYIKFGGDQIPKHCAENLAEGIVHRGPDGTHVMHDAQERFVFVHTLLKIMDKSDGAIQPIQDDEGNVLIFNGSIYNYQELKSQYKLDADLNDTHTLFALLKIQGKRILGELEGMFALIYFDASQQHFLIARDRFGEKPLFYAHTSSGDLILASERKSLWNLGIPKKPKVATALNFLLYNDLGGLTELYEDIDYLAPGHFAVITDGDIKTQEISYGKEDEEKSLDACMLNSVKLTHIADFPIAHTLSGGIDSGGLLSYSKEIGRPEVFSFRSPGAVEDESTRTQRIAIFQGLNKVHWVEFPEPEQILQDWRVLSQIHEEPLASPSSLAQYYLYQKIAETGHRVVLEGQGSDELFCGYTYYFEGLLSDKIPSAKYILHESNQEERRTWRKWFLHKLSPYVYQKLYRQKGMKIANMIHLDKTIWQQYQGHISDQRMKAAGQGVRNQMKRDRNLGLFQYILRTADRSSMFQHIEVRLPYLNSNIIDLSARLQLPELWQSGYFKYYLRKYWKGRLPDDILWRKEKNGFEAPYDKLLAHEEFKNLLKEATYYFHNMGWLARDEPIEEKNIEPLLYQIMAWKMVSLYLAIR